MNTTDLLVQLENGLLLVASFALTRGATTSSNCVGVRAALWQSPTRPGSGCMVADVFADISDCDFNIEDNNAGAQLSVGDVAFDVGVTAIGEVIGFLDRARALASCMAAVEEGELR